MLVLPTRQAKRKWSAPIGQKYLPLVLFHVFQAYSHAFCQLRSERFPQNAFRERNLQLSELEDYKYSWIVPEGVPFGSLDKMVLRPMDSSNSISNQTSLCTVSTKAVGLNFADIFCILGLYSAANDIRGDAAFCPGLEYAGVVKDDPTGTFTPGQRVLGFSRFGAYADIVKVPPYFLHPLPSNWTFSQGAGFLVQALTAWHGLVEIGGMPDFRNEAEENKKNFVVLIHSAAGGVGLWAAEIAARRGAIVVGLVGSDTKKSVFEKRILPLSPKSRVMLRGDEGSFGKRLALLLSEIHGSPILPDESKKARLVKLRNHGHGVDVVMESLGGRYFSESFEAMNRGGSLVTFGSTSYVTPGLSINKIRLIWRYLTRPRIDPGTLTSRNIRLSGFNLIYLTDLPDQLRRELNDCIRCLSGGGERSPSPDDDLSLLDLVTPPVIGESYDFYTETIKAMEKLKSGQTVGKVVLEKKLLEGKE